MNTLGRSFFIITTVLSIALACAGCGASAGNLAVANVPSSEPTAATTPTAAPPATLAPTPSAASSAAGLLLDGEPATLKPGRYVFESSHTGVPPQLANSYPRMSFTVPAGWSGNARLVGKTVADGDPAAPFLLDWQFDHGFQDPCTDHTPVVPKAGTGAAGLLGVIARQPGLDAGKIYGNSPAGIKDVTVGGHDGKYLDYSVTADPAACGNGHDGFWIWGSCPPPVTIGCEDADGGDARWGASKGNRERAYAIDVDGTIYTFFTVQPSILKAADRAELQRFLDSIQFEPSSN